MLNCRFVPIDHWSGEKTRKRTHSPFEAKYLKLLDDLERELKYLGAHDIVVQAFVAYEDLRNDGWPRSSARFREPGIILSFRNKSGDQVSFPCDTYLTWEGNLRAIGLTLTALRSIDRYGVTKRGEQYTGWKRLTPPSHEAKRDRNWALNHLAVLASVEPFALRDSAAVQLAYRVAARKTHPDSGGNTEAFQLLQDAMRLLSEAA